MLIIPALSAQIIKPVKWTFSVNRIDEQQVDLIFKADIQAPWHMYGLNIPEGGPIPITIDFENIKGFELVGKPSQSPKPEIVDDQIFNMKLELHSKKATFIQRIRKKPADSITITGILNYMTCSDMQCVLGDQDFTFRMEGAKTAQPQTDQKTDQRESASTADTITKTLVADADTAMDESAPATVPAKTKEASDTLWGLFLLSVLGGLGGLLTPCVYPMIPMTVSYFLRGNKTRSRAISEALIFGFSIIIIYTLIGVLVALFKNPNAVNNFNTHWITNIIFFLIFIVLSASFFGMFELVLPSGFANKVDRQADKGGYIGAFFMALAMAVLSFSCTGPIVASLLIKASQGDVMEPVIGMFGFSLIFALPFTLFAIFPSWLKGLPKSGGWLNAIKVFFAFIMLAFSLYFLVKIDQAYHLNILSRELFLSIWIVIFSLLGLYLLGKIKFAHDSDLPHVGFPRFMMAVISFSFALYLFTGLLGNSLRGLSTILPPEKSVQNLVSVNSVENKSTLLCNVPRYSDFLELPHGIKGYFDYDEALACAKEQKKPVLVDFVGHTCSNCKKMYAEVWSDPRIIQLLNEKFIVAALYTDDNTKLPEADWISGSDGKVKKTMGKKNQELQISRFISNALPLYIIVDENGKDLSHEYYTYDPDPEKMIRWLESATKDL